MWIELQETLPFISEGERHSQVINVYDDVRVKQPGKYADVTKGGDFVVETLISESWKPYRHDELLLDIELKALNIDNDDLRRRFSSAILDVVETADPVVLAGELDELSGGMPVEKLLKTIQVISVAEHRRCPSCEPVGGRYLLPRFALGIINGQWTATDANTEIRTGKKGLRMLRHRYGKEPGRKELKQTG